MQATQIDPDRFGSEFPESHKIEAGDILEVSSFKEFTSKKSGLRGVALTLKDGTLAHTTTKQPVGYILSEKLNLAGLIAKAKDKCITLYFTSAKPNTSRDSMLRCSIFPPTS